MASIPRAFIASDEIAKPETDAVSTYCVLTNCSDDQGEGIGLKRQGVEAVSVVVGQPQHGT